MGPLTFLPIRGELKPFIQSIVILDADFTSLSMNSEYHYPWMAKASIFFTINDEPVLMKYNQEYIPIPLCYVVGPRLVNDTINFGKKRRTVGITFKAGAFQRLMGIPVHLLTNESFDAHQVFGKETEIIEQRLKEAGNNFEIQHIIENFLLKRIFAVHSFSLFDYAIEQCVNSKGNIPIEKLASIACISIRQFERKCRESLGIPPKLFSRLTRFSMAYVLKEKNPKLNWGNIANESGYFDQMHLIHDFKAFSGYSPSHLNQLENQNLKILSILEESSVTH